MKLTPLDIHHKEFRHSLRGYAEEEVDQFLDEVADEFERLFKENIDMNERLDAVNARLREFELKESAVNNAIIAAQTAGEDMKNKARAEADATRRDAEIRAKEIIHNALSKKQQVAAELVRIKAAEEDFRARFRALLEDRLRAVTEVALPDDVTVLLGETDEGMVADVEVKAPAPMPQPAPVQAPVAAPEPAAPAVQMPTQAMPPVQPVAQAPTGQVVSAVALGETGTPEIPEDIQFVDPSEFSLPSFDVLGEREDDLDIEEID